MDVSRVKPEEIQFDPDNPNVGNDGRGARSLQESLSRFGFRDPGVLDAKSRLVAGNQRMKNALSTLKPTEAIVIDISPEDSDKPVFVRYSDLDLEDPSTGARQLSYALNRTAQLNLRWDPERIRRHREQVDLSHLFTHSEMVTLGAREDTVDSEEESTLSALDALQKKWQVSAGDLFALPRDVGEPHLLLCGDSTHGASWEMMRTHFGESSLLVTDPPYGASYSSKQKRLNRLTGSNGRLENNIASDTPAEMADVWEPVFTHARASLQDEASYYIFSQPGGRGGQVRTLLNVLFLCGYGDTHILVWLKDNQPYSQTDYKYPYELIHYGWFERHNFQAGFEMGLLHYPRPRKNTFHPTQKPVPLLVRLIENSSEPFDTVLDPFCGSGSTLLACDAVKRRCIGIELEPVYVAAALERFNATTDRIPTKIN